MSIQEYREKIGKAITDRSLFLIAERKLLKRILFNDAELVEDFLRDRELKRLRKKYSRYIKKHETEPQMEPSNKVWIFWRQGFENAPPLVKACAASVRKHLNDWELHFLSEDNLEQFVTLPDFIQKKHDKGIISEAQYSDLVRIALLAKYGGLWLDATVYCTGVGLPERLKSCPLFFFQKVSLVRPSETAGICSSWCIASYKGNPFIRDIRNLMYQYWTKEDRLKNYYLIHLFTHMVKDAYPEMWSAMPVYNNISPHILQFEMFERYDEKRFDEIRAMSDLHKLNHHVTEEGNKEDSFYRILVRDYL